MTAVATRFHQTTRTSLRPAPASSRRLPAVLLALFLTSWASMVHAAEPAVAVEPPRLAQAPEPLCFCWSDGRKIAEGAAACIRTTQGRRLAQCGRVINMMSWQVTETPCPES